MKVDPPFPHAGPAPRVAAPSGSLREGDTNLGQVQSKPKRSPLEINPQAERGVWCVGCGCVVVCRRFPSGLEIAHQTPLPRAWPLATLLRKATFGRATLAYARHNNRGCRESYPQCTLACAFPIGRGSPFKVVASAANVCFASCADNSARSGATRAAKPPKEKRGGFLPSKLGENLPRFSCPRQVP